MPRQNRRRPALRTSLLAATALAGAMALALGPTAAYAAGWGTISTRSVGKALSATAWTNLHPGFSTAANVAYRYCVTIKGNGTANLQPQAFGTSVTVNSSSYVTRCTKGYSGPANHFTPTASRIGSGSVTIGSISIQRYYTGSIPV